MKAYRELEWPYNLCKEILGEGWEKCIGVEVSNLRLTAEYVVQSCLRDLPKHSLLILSTYRDGAKLKDLTALMDRSLEKLVPMMKVAEQKIRDRVDPNMLLYGIDNYILKLKIEGRYTAQSEIMDPENGSRRAANEKLETLNLMPIVLFELRNHGINTVGDLLRYPNRYALKNDVGLTNEMLDNIQKRLMVCGYYYEHLNAVPIKERKYLLYEDYFRKP